MTALTMKYQTLAIVRREEAKRTEIAAHGGLNLEQWNAAVSEWKRAVIAYRRAVKAYQRHCMLSGVTFCHVYYAFGEQPSA